MALDPSLYFQHIIAQDILTPSTSLLSSLFSLLSSLFSLLSSLYSFIFISGLESCFLILVSIFLISYFQKIV
jgi:hypothetical protein